MISDPVNHPAHYQPAPGVEVIDLTETLPFNRGNVIKYVARAHAKGSELEDLQKALWYLQREIRRISKAEG
jgi:hypothetical protein